MSELLLQGSCNVALRSFDAVGLSALGGCAYTTPAIQNLIYPPLVPTIIDAPWPRA